MADRAVFESSRRIARVDGLIDSGGLRVAELEQTAVAALVVGIAPPYVPPAQRPKLRGGAPAPHAPGDRHPDQRAGLSV